MYFNFHIHTMRRRMYETMYLRQMFLLCTMKGSLVDKKQNL